MDTLDGYALALRFLLTLKQGRVMDRNGKAALAAVEVIIWQLVTEGSLRSEPLAAELERYAGFSGNTAGALQVLAKVARAAKPRAALSGANHERQSRHGAIAIGSSSARN